jgi:hypothetical protein
MRPVLSLLLASSASMLAACGGGNEAADEPTAQASAAPSATAQATTSTVTLTQRIAAATSVATTAPACTALTTFYWEIGDKTGKLASGSGGKAPSVTPVTATTPLPVASASKWVFATYAVEKRKGVLSTSDVAFLNFTSGYANLNDCSSSSSVSSCLSEAGVMPGTTNGTYFSNRDGHFFYNGGHMQVLASQMGLGSDTNTPLATGISSVDGNLGLTYANPQVAGGAVMSANAYTAFLRNQLNGTYRYMPSQLGTHAVCTHTNGSDCPAAQFSPINESKPGTVNDISDERWHYSLGHWVEDDPTVGDGAFSSPGRFGYYPWIDKSKTYYGVVARYDPNGALSSPTHPPYYASAQCGRQIRAAWMNPTATAAATH